MPYKGSGPLLTDLVGGQIQYSFETFNWYGISGPGKLPTPIAAKMNKDINSVLAMPDVREKFEAFCVEDGGGSPEKFAKLVRSEIAKWAKVAKEANARVDG